MQRSFRFPPSFVALAMGVLLLGTISNAQAQTSRQIQRFQDSDTIEQLRDKIRANGYSFTVGHNRIFDMSPEEKASFFRTRAPEPEKTIEDTGPGPLADIVGAALPSSFDWRNYEGHSYIGPVRDQGTCGDCYAFGAAAAAESAYNISNSLYDDQTIDFSESYIAWCLGTYGPYADSFDGCKGADYSYAELGALTKEGVTYESYFPYIVKDPKSCTHWSDPVVTFESWHRIACGDIDAMKTAIVNYGALDVAVDASSAFQAYSGGIYEDTETTCSGNPCDQTVTDHAVALVGWDDNGGDGYWILRNSWGDSWGENGYMRIKYTSALVACEATYLVYNSRPATTGSLQVTITPTAAVSGGAKWKLAKDASWRNSGDVVTGLQAGTTPVISYQDLTYWTKPADRIVSITAGDTVKVTGEYVEKLFADFTAAELVGKAPFNASFTDNSQGSIASRFWDFGDGKTSTQLNPKHTYSKPGVYTVKLTVTSSLSGQTNTMTHTDYIAVYTQPKAKFTVSPARGKVPFDATFTDKSLGTRTSWLWDFGDGTTSSGQVPQPHQYAAPGPYTVTLTVSNNYGASSATTKKITALKPLKPVAKFTASPVKGAAPLAVTFADASTGAVTTWNWDFGDGGTSSSRNPGSHTFVNPGVYTVTLTAGNQWESTKTVKKITATAGN